MRSGAKLVCGQFPHLPTTLTVISIVHNMESQCEMRKTGTAHAQQGSGALLGSNLQSRDSVPTQLDSGAKLPEYQWDAEMM